MKDHYSKKKQLIDLGCGSGILPIIMNQNAGFSGQINCVDSMENALEASKMNAQLFGIIGEDKIRT